MSYPHKSLNKNYAFSENKIGNTKMPKAISLEMWKLCMTQWIKNKALFGGGITPGG